ncbi:MAG TPA: thioredoxin [Turneriella sp.]|nr:thioredoxin [Turneriella sp.]HNL53742.1 thioredoxin [Turneriella sp.]
MDVTTAEFEEKVIRESHKRPVVVDFWAPWCGPCRTLTPTLEGLETEYAGKFALAKVNTDAEQQLGQAYQVMSIPDVKIFKDGKIVGGFVGAQPADRIREILDQFIVPEDYLKVLNLSQNSPAEAKALLPKLKGKRLEEAAWAVARGFLVQQAIDTVAASECLQLIPEFGSAFSEARTAALAMLSDGQTKELATLIAGKEENTKPLLDGWISQIEDSKDKQKDKEIMIRAFHIMGNEHPLTLDYRRRLSRVLF